MAYVRTHGNQLTIVQGERDPETRKVEQRVLFTIYSRAEARELLERGRGLFENLMEHEHPEVRFDWTKIRAGVAQKLDVLPEDYPSQAERLQHRFRSGLCAFTRQLALADPQTRISSARLIQSQRHELEFLRELIEWRLSNCEREETEWNWEDQFHWRSRLSQRDVPVDVEGLAQRPLGQHQLDEAQAIFRLLTESFEGYADGHTHLGMIALERRDFDEAITQFEHAVAWGRRKFPKRVSKSEVGDLLEARPYLRALDHLALALNRAGRYDRALEVCERIERESCGHLFARACRASIALNVGRWEEVLTLVDQLHRTLPETSLLGGLAAFELDRLGEAAWRFLHGAFNRPRAARILLDMSRPRLPTSNVRSLAIDDHNVGVDLKRDLHGFLSQQHGASSRFFRGLLGRPEVDALSAELFQAMKRWAGSSQLDPESTVAFRRLQQIRTPEFAREQAVRLHLLEDPQLSRQEKWQKEAKAMWDETIDAFQVNWPFDRDAEPTGDASTSSPSAPTPSPESPRTQGLLRRRPIYQLKITLEEADPPVWRRVLVSGNRSMKRVHELLQVVMGWTNSHLHLFELPDGSICSDPDFELDHDSERDEAGTKLRSLAKAPGDRFTYVYDFGDNWRHTIEVEAITAAEVREPHCVEGEGAGPPEDVGGVGGYEEFLAALADPEHERHEEFVVWAGEGWRPEFDLEATNRALRASFKSS